MEYLVNRSYFKRKKSEIFASVFCFTISTILILFSHYFWAILPGFFLIIILIDLIKGLKFHRNLIDWVDKNPNSFIFIYSSKKQYLEVIEKEILPVVKSKVFIVKNDNAIITGDLPRELYYEIHHSIIIKDLPLLISIKENKYLKTTLKIELNRFINKEIDQIELISFINQKLN